MMDLERYTDKVGNKWDSDHTLTFKEETDWMAPVGGQIQKQVIDEFASQLQIRVGAKRA